VHKTSPFTSLITVSGVLFTLSFFALCTRVCSPTCSAGIGALTEELLYLARRPNLLEPSNDKGHAPPAPKNRTARWAQRFTIRGRCR